MGLPGWPGGDPDKLKDAADAWDKLHESLLNVVETADPAMQTLFDQWEGQAATSFETTWTKFAGVHTKAATGAAAVGTALDTFADKLEEAHKKYEHMVEAMAATAVVGLGLAIFTGGLSAAAGAAAEASVAAEVTALLVDLGLDIEAAVTVATTAAEAVGGAVETAVGAAVDFSIGFVMSAGDQALESELDGDGFQVKWDQAVLAGLTSAALGPLMRGKTLPVRVAIGAGGMGASGALSQLDDLLLHGGLKDGESFNLKTLLVDLVAGGALGATGKGPAVEDGALKDLQKMIDDLADDPAMADLISLNPDLIEVYAANPEIMKAITATIKTDTTFVVSPTGVIDMIDNVKAVVVEVNAPRALSEYTQEEMYARFVEKGIDIAKEDIKKAIEGVMEEYGGPGKVAEMSPAELRRLANEAVSHIPTPAHH